MDLSLGASNEAAWLRKKIDEIFSAAAPPASELIKREEIIAQLLEEYREALALGDADGYSPPSQSALSEATNLVGSLPTWMLTPTPHIEPSGAIAFEWDVGPGRFFVLAVDGTGRIECSAILSAGDESHGVFNFSGTVPIRAQKLLAELLSGE